MRGAMMASEKKYSSKEGKTGYQPKATARHAKITKTKQEEIDAFKKKISTDKYLAKKYESDTKAEIRALPKEERAAAKEELRQSVARRKESEHEDKMKLRIMQHEERVDRVRRKDEVFDEEAWLKGGRKTGRTGCTKEAGKGPEAASKEENILEEGPDSPDPDAQENTAEGPLPVSTDEED
jgi:hypothetical protein